MRLIVFLGLCVIAAPALGEDRAPDAATFFETKIRPVLAARCFKCHGQQKAASALRLDSRDALLKGGDNGPAVVAGDPAKSLLLTAVRYQDDDLKMPPDKPLPAEVVADLERWIAAGAFWPETAANVALDAGPHWSFQPVRPVAVPATSADGDAPSGAPGTHTPLALLDCFILAKLQQQGLNLSEPADKPALLRRATFDLIGLPPTPDEVADFLADNAPDAFARVVERLLASPAYGQRWGRHWLDLVRYTDEFEESWRYRDWVVDAHNADLPYDQFISQQIAGDLLPPRAPQTGGVNADGIVATTMLSLGPWSGIDRKKRLTDIVDDQIDIVGRSVLGLTIACARCHNHKFDPITTADYYGLAGIFLSSRVISDEGYLSHGTNRLRIPLVGEVDVERHRQHDARVKELSRQVQAAVDERYAEFARRLLPQTARYLLAAWDFEHRPEADAKLSLDDFAQRENLHAFALTQWTAYLKGAPFASFPPLDVPERNFDDEPGVLAWRVRAERPWWAFNTNDREVAIETFCLPPRSLSINPGTEGGAVSWRSPISGTVQVAGSMTDCDPLDGVGIAWVVDRVRNGARHELSSGISFKGTVELAHGRTPRQLAAIDVEPGDEICLQIRLRQGDAHYDITTVELTISELDGAQSWDLVRDVAGNFLQSNPHRDSLKNPGVWHFTDMAGSHRLERMPAVDPLLTDWRAAAAAKNPAAERREFESAAQQFQQAIAAAPPESALVDDLTGSRSPFWVKTRDDAKYLSAEAQAALKTQAAALETLKQSLPPLPCANGVCEGGLRHSLYPGMQDAPIHVRGSYEQLAARVPRRFPEVLTPRDQPPIRSGSGRLELARWLTSADNPLTARVLVNRLWQHHFGEGLVRTPSNFGLLGEPPTHTELLDFLAARFVESGWSVKDLHRLILLSATYGQSSRAGAESLKADPENRLLGRMNRTRPEAESIHDALLAVTGRLNRAAGGPANTAADSPRRLLYKKTTRIGSAGMGALFDGANASMHVERRTVSTVAPQALFLMNEPWIADSATRILARPAIAAATDPPERIQQLYLLLFGRAATATEMELGARFVAQLQAEPATAAASPTAPTSSSSAGASALQGPPGSSGQPDPWAVYTQALLLSNEFLFVD